MIYGIGTDIAHIPRFEQVYLKQGNRFARHILTPTEYSQFLTRHAKNPARGIRFLATRFAAKEAFSKACGLGLHMPMHWHTVQVINLASGQPSVQGLGRMAEWLNERHITTKLSISDERDYAVAFVVMETAKAI